ncbi:MAG TPA: tetratricopeptide repeat protein [Polyangia bacterium]|nr:tetratricopeptide repeat protein [Polyangia bacterium]
MTAALALAALWLVADGGAPVDAPAAASEIATTNPAAKSGARAAHEAGLAALRAGRANDAAAFFARAAEGDPANAAFATDLGFALAKLGRRAEAEAALRAAIDKDPKRFYAYVNLADLLADDPTRWDRREAIVAFLDKGLEKLKDDRKGQLNLLLRVAAFERAVGRTEAARARLAPLVADTTSAALTPAQRKRVLDELDAITLDERSRALEAWPAPDVSAGDRRLADDATTALAAGRPEDARATADALARRHPTWERARVLRGRALEALGRVDDAASDLEIAVNLAPSDAEAWRALGRLLALQGGALEADRADEALRHALALEPAWTDLRALREQLAHRRAGLVAPTPAPRATPPTDHARALFQEAEAWIDVGDPAGLGRDLVAQALSESPAYVAAAVTNYSLTGAVPDATIAALWNDGDALWALVSGVRRVAGTRAPGALEARLEKPDGRATAADALVRPWIDRAVTLDVQEARFARALARVAVGDRPGALDDLAAYVAREPRPAHLAEARALRAGLLGREAEGHLSPELLARIRLFEDRPDAALRALGGACAPNVPVDRLTEMGIVHEYAGRLAEARACYELAAAIGDGADAASRRLARLDARLPDDLFRGVALAPLRRTAARGDAAATWALARRAGDEGEIDDALEGADRALVAASARADVADVWVPEAHAARARWAAAGQARRLADAERRRRIVVGAGLAVALALALFLRRRFAGKTLAAALARRPALFPDVARVVGELRHDVLKHRAGVLGMAADPATSRDDLRKALLEPRPASADVAAAYEALAHAAKGQGLTLRPLSREPVLGALAADLARAERSLAAPSLDVARVLALDERLRGAHAERLAALLQQGPRTRLDAHTLSDWIAAVEATVRADGERWVAPALALGDLDVELPVESAALHAIFANLLRNAQAAVASDDGGRVIVRVTRARDVTGRQLVSLDIGDSASAALTLEAIEARESGRGLAIVRDLVRQWRGHLVVHPEPAPFTKVVGACFPA